MRPNRVIKWTRYDTETVADHGIFEVQRSKIKDPAGNPKRAVTTIRCNDWCNILPVTPDGSAVFIWQYRFGSDDLSLEIPGGVIDTGEDPKAAAIRELEEESGYRSANVEVLSILEPNPAIQGNRIHSYVAWDALPTGNVRFDDLEDCETVLVPIKQLPTLLDAGRISHALCTVAIETFLRRHGNKWLSQAR